MTQDNIILTAAEADKVRGVTTPGNALAPVPLKDGTFMMPLEVLTDPAHKEKAALLKSLPIRAVDLGTPPATINAVKLDGEIAVDPVMIDKYRYKSDWPVGATIDALGAITRK